MVKTNTRMVPVKVAEAKDLKTQLESCKWADYWLLALEDETGKILKAIGYGERPTEIPQRTIANI